LRIGRDTEDHRGLPGLLGGDIEGTSTETGANLGIDKLAKLDDVPSELRTTCPM
jgi:hypothetical protein